MKSFKHFNAATVDDAILKLTAHNQSMIIAGGTDCLSVLKNGVLPTYPEVLVNIKTIPGLAFIKEEGDGLRIGALSRLSDIADSPIVKEKYAILGDAARSVGSPQIRSMATLGGNLCQDVRCWYYRYPFQIGGRILCLRKGGRLCNALTGDHRYHSVFGAAGMVGYPCSSNCPADADIRSCLSRIRDGDWMGAAQIVTDFNPMPAITGRVCPIFCEPECYRSELDESVAIRCIERSLGDEILERMTEIYRPPERESNQKIAVVGSGPSGLSAAYYLRRSGYRVTVYERMAEPGGMLLYGIPPYRLPKGVVRRQIEAFRRMGIRFEMGVEVGEEVSVSGLMRRFDAVYMACGAWKERPLGIKGEKAAQSGLEFLNWVNGGLREIPGKRVAVIGGGNVALDVARTLRRLGGEAVVIYRRRESEMPVIRDEVGKAKEEGVEFQFLTQPIEVSKKDGGVTLKCKRMKLGSFDSSGRPRPIAVPGSEFTVKFDAVIKAIGEEGDTSVLPSRFRKKGLKGGVSVDQLGKRLFVGGDFTRGPSTVVEAVASGRDAARRIEGSLRVGKSSVKESRREAEFTRPFFEAIPRVRAPELQASERLKGIDVEDRPGLGLRGAEREASRCFNCGCIAVNPSDLGVALVALDAKIVTTKRALDAQDFFTAGATRSTVLEPDELVTEIQIPKLPKGARQTFRKFRLRKAIDFAIVNVASVVTTKNGYCKEARITLGGVGPTPIRASQAEKRIKGKAINPDTAEEAAREAVAGAAPLIMNAYKVQIAKTLVKRALLALGMPSLKT
ncbi:MAG: FAD-dependent oxidoreductase [Thermodesulfobacteriota bacterium]